MTEQDLLDYEGAFCEKEELLNEYMELKSEYFSCGTVDLQRAGKNGTVADVQERLINLVDKMEQKSKERIKAQAEFDHSYDCIGLAYTVCNIAERDYLQKRYILCLTNKEIAKLTCMQIRDIYRIRKNILEKIKNL